MYVIKKIVKCRDTCDMCYAKVADTLATFVNINAAFRYAATYNDNPYIRCKCRCEVVEVETQ